MPNEIIVITTVLLLYAVVVVSPGPNFALISRLATSRPRQTAIGATLGLTSAATFYAVLSMSGFALLLTRIGGCIERVTGTFLVLFGLRLIFERRA